MTAYILHIAREDAAPGEPGAELTLRLTVTPEGVTLDTVTPDPHPGGELARFDLPALAAALVGRPLAPTVDAPAGGVRRRARRRRRRLRPGRTG